MAFVMLPDLTKKSLALSFYSPHQVLTHLFSRLSSPSSLHLFRSSSPLITFVLLC